MKAIKVLDYTIYLNKFERSFKWFYSHSDYSNVHILSDADTVKYCLPLFKELSGIKDYNLIIVPAGDACKNLQTAKFVWESLFDAYADRYTLMINLGGGAISDLGGFCAGTYMRGIDFVHIPTTLLSQVDAAMGGKVALDFNNCKNLIGFFQNPVYVFVEPSFLKSLPEREYRSGIVEVIKHAIIASPHLLSELETKGIPPWQEINPVLEKSLLIKKQIVEADPFDKNKRQLLNFGHSIGHAVEGMFFDMEKPILHGEAVAFGMMVELMISYMTNDFPEQDLERLLPFLKQFTTKDIKALGKNEIVERIRWDKKNNAGQMMFTLVKDIANAHYGYPIKAAIVREAIDRVKKTYF